MKRIFVTIFIIIIILAGAYITYRFLLKGRSILVASAEGSVEIESGGVWIPLMPGARIQKNARIRTTGGRAVLALAPGVNIEVKEGSEVLVEDIKKDGISLQLISGELKTDISEGAKGSISLKTLNNRLDTTSGRFTFSTDGKETLTIASEEKGSLLMDGKEVSINKEEKVTFSEGKEVFRAEKEKPLKLLVNWPPPKINKKEVEINGETEPGAFVRINENGIYAGKDGIFRIKLNLEEGENRILILARDALGREKREEGTIEVDTSIPDIKIEHKFEWR
jgi:hypothetical protein